MRLARSQLLAYSAPALPLAAMYFPVYVFLAEFYASEFGFSLGFIGAVYLAVRVFDAVSDPAMGAISDRLPTRWGRRRPWLAVGTPLVMVGVWFLFVPPVDPSRAWFATFLFLLTLGWTIILTPWYAWGAEMTGDYAERGRVTIWRDSIGLAGTILAAILYNAGGEGVGGMMFVASLIVLCLPTSVIWCLARVPEPRDFSRAGATAGSLLSVIRAEPLFPRLLGAYFVNGAANALPATLFLFFVEYRLDAPGWGGPLLIVYFGAAVAAAPFWSFMVKHMSKHRLWCWAMIYAAVVFLFALALGPGDVWPFAAICLLSGAALGADLALPTAMQADLVDLDTARTGRQRTGAFFALWSLATKLALAGAGGLALILLEGAGFGANQQNSDFALWALVLLYALAPVVLKSISIRMMWSFPLDAAKQGELRNRIERDAGAPA